MRKALIDGGPDTLWHLMTHTLGRANGPTPHMRGDWTGLRGDCTGLRGYCTGLLYGDCTGLYGDFTGLYGCCTGLRGDLDDCGLTAEDRARGVLVSDLVKEDAR